MYEILENTKWNKVDQWLCTTEDRRKRLTTKGYAGTFGDDRNFLYLDFGDVYISVYICQTHQIVH